MTDQQNHREIKDWMERMEKKMCGIEDTLKPISEAYGTVIRLGKWGKWFLGFVLLIISIFVGIKQLFR